jgi:hypothetical protein
MGSTISSATGPSLGMSLRRRGRSGARHISAMIDFPTPSSPVYLSSLVNVNHVIHWTTSRIYKQILSTVSGEIRPRAWIESDEKTRVLNCFCSSSVASTSNGEPSRDDAQAQNLPKQEVALVNLGEVYRDQKYVCLFLSNPELISDRNARGLAEVITSVWKSGPVRFFDAPGL